MAIGLCTDRILSDQVRNPNTVSDSPGTNPAGDVATCTVKVFFSFTALNDRVAGFTEMVTPRGATTVDVYTDFAGPTFVTVLVNVVDRIFETD